MLENVVMRLKLSPKRKGNNMEEYVVSAGSLSLVVAKDKVQSWIDLMLDLGHVPVIKLFTREDK